MTNDFVCEMLDPKDVEAAGKIIINAFLEQNAMYRAMQFTYSDLYPFIAQVLPICISEGSAFSCKNRDGVIIGAAICYPDDANVFSRLELDSSGRMAASMPQFALLTEKTEAYLKPLRKDKKLVNFALIGISEEAKGHGIATALTHFIIDALSDRFDAAYLEALSCPSRRSAEKSGFVFLGETPYKDSGIEALKNLEGSIYLGYLDFTKKKKQPVRPD